MFFRVPGRYWRNAGAGLALGPAELLRPLVRDLAGHRSKKRAAVAVFTMAKTRLVASAAPTGVAGVEASAVMARKLLILVSAEPEQQAGQDPPDGLRRRARRGRSSDLRRIVRRGAKSASGA